MILQGINLEAKPEGFQNEQEIAKSLPFIEDRKNLRFGMGGYLVNAPIYAEHFKGRPQSLYYLCCRVLGMDAPAGGTKGEELKRVFQLFYKTYGITPMNFVQVLAAKSADFWTPKKHTKLFNYLCFRHGKKIEPVKARAFWLMTPIFDQNEKDGVSNISPWCFHFATDPHGMRGILGKGLWRKLCSNSMHKNVWMAEIAVRYARHVALARTVLTPIPLHPSIDKSMDTQVFAVLGRLRTAVNTRQVEDIKRLIDILHASTYQSAKLMPQIIPIMPNTGAALRCIESYLNLANLGQIRRQKHDALADAGIICDVYRYFDGIHPVEINPKWSMRRFHEAHDRMVRELAAETRKRPGKTYVWEPFPSMPKEFSQLGLTAYRLDTHEEVLAEGARMKHCLGSYVARIRNYEYVAYSISDASTGSPISTLGLRVTKLGRFHNEYFCEEIVFDQNKSFCNKTPQHPNMDEFVNLLIRQKDKSKFFPRRSG